MTILRQDFVGADSATITIANSSAGGDPISLAYGNPVYRTASARHGTSGMRCDGNRYIRWTPTTDQILVTCYLATTSTTPAANWSPLTLGLSSGAIAVNITTTGQVQVWYSGASRALSPNPLTAGQTYRLQLHTDPAEGTLRIAIYEGDSTTPWWDSSTITGLTINPIARIDIGVITPSSAAIVDIDSITIRTDTDATWAAYPWTPATPAITTSTTQPTTTNGTITVTWPPVDGATHYETQLRTGTHTTGFTPDDTDATSPKTYTDLPAGDYTIAVRAIS